MKEAGPPSHRMRKCLCLRVAETLPSVEMEAALTERRWPRKAMYLCGTPGLERDLLRCSVNYASALFFVCSTRCVQKHCILKHLASIAPRISEGCEKPSGKHSD